ncbi:alpha-amylase family glycosyl hydrolase [Reichenbachiella sp.]|uniref:alpha-amylase family glycosyl hydrolase n=1 Tax=Reichenbachiella sp. TaxID=2184521 RepID=UPI003B5A770F
MTRIQLLAIIFLASLCFLFACEPSEQKTKESSITFPERAADMTIYEVNIRQYTPEGTIKAFMKHLPRLKELGVEMLWIMPVQPIGQENRKGSLGSYYSISNYSTVNPEFGTLDDFKALVNEVHDLDMTIILDWVPNHTAWDHPWIKSNPEYYAKDSLGNITYEADWNDIALLDHTNEGTRKSMIEEMKFWVTETDIDGFRCDHAAHEIPLYFWEEATAALDPLKDLFWLAEWDEPQTSYQLSMPLIPGSFCT